MRAMSSGIRGGARHWPRAILARAWSSTHRRSCLSVITQPGTNVLTRMPKGPKSRARLRVRPCTAALAVVYTGMPPCLSIQLTEPRLTIDPAPAAFMSAATFFAAKNWCLRLTAMPASQLSGVVASMAWRWSLAALLISAAIGPIWPRSLAIAASSAPMSVRSAAENTGACREFSRRITRLAAELSSMSMNPTRAPCRANCSTSAAPMPVAPPVTSTVRSCRLG